MDIRERAGDPFEALRVALDGRQVTIWTALPGIIESFNPTQMTCVVQPSIQGRVRDVTTGVISLVNLPTLLDCPVQFPGGGGVTTTFPVKQGDECLVVFSSRCIDAWWYLGGVQPPLEARMHDLSDGFVLLGFRSKPRVLPNISTTSAQMRSDDGVATVDLNPTSHVVTVTAPGGIGMVGPTKITGTLEVTGKVTCDAGLAVTGGETVDTLQVSTSADLANGSGTFIKTLAGTSTTAKA